MSSARRLSARAAHADRYGCARWTVVARPAGPPREGARPATDELGGSASGLIAESCTQFYGVAVKTRPSGVSSGALGSSKRFDPVFTGCRCTIRRRLAAPRTRAGDGIDRTAAGAPAHSCEPDRHLAADQRVPKAARRNVAGSHVADVRLARPGRAAACGCSKQWPARGHRARSGSSSRDTMPAQRRAQRATAAASAGDALPALVP